MLDFVKKLLGLVGGPPDDNGMQGRPPPGGMVTCQEALDHLFEYLDGELEGEDQKKVRKHFEICQRCYPRLAFEKAFQEAIHRVRSGETAPERVKDQVLQLIQEEGYEDD